MTTLFLVRHGETEEFGEHLMGWRTGCRLSASGRTQVQRLAERLSPLPIRAVYTSPLERTVETAKAIARLHKLVPMCREALGEVRFGQWEGMAIAELALDPEWQRFNARRSIVRAPGGESMIEVQVRMIREIEAIQRQHIGEATVVVSHADPLRALIAHYLGIPLDLMLRFEVSPASVTKIEGDTAEARVLCLNNTGTDSP